MRHLKLKRRVWALLLGASLTACGAGEAPAPSEDADAPAAVMVEIPDFVMEAADVAKSLDSAPERAMEILSEHGWSAEQFKSAMVEISLSPELSQAFESARGS